MKIDHLCHRKLDSGLPSTKILYTFFPRFVLRLLSISKCSISASFESCAFRFRRVINPMWHFCILVISNQHVNFRRPTTVSVLLIMLLVPKVSHLTMIITNSLLIRKLFLSKVRYEVFHPVVEMYRSNHDGL